MCACVSAVNWGRNCTNFCGVFTSKSERKERKRKQQSFSKIKFLPTKLSSTGYRLTYRVGTAIPGQQLYMCVNYEVIDRLPTLNDRSERNAAVKNDINMSRRRWNVL